MEPAQTGVKTWQWVVTAIVIIVLIIIGIMVFGNKKGETPIGGDNMSTSTDNGTVSQEVNRVVMTDQYPGNVVYLGSVQLAKGGWVVIHKDNNGTPGAVIGTQWLDAGLSAGTKITLTQSTTEGGLYYVMLHSDDGDKVFNETKDLPLKDSRDSVIMKPFRAYASVGAGIKG
ncbi:MAG: hypothetical protein V4481_04625 [Patescibacteria group bacterium]